MTTNGIARESGGHNLETTRDLQKVTRKTLPISSDQQLRSRVGEAAPSERPITIQNPAGSHQEKGHQLIQLIIALI